MPVGFCWGAHSMRNKPVKWWNLRVKVSLKTLCANFGMCLRSPQLILMWPMTADCLLKWEKSDKLAPGAPGSVDVDALMLALEEQWRNSPRIWSYWRSGTLVLISTRNTQSNIMIAAIWFLLQSHLEMITNRFTPCEMKIASLSTVLWESCNIQFISDSFQHGDGSQPVLMFNTSFLTTSTQLINNSHNCLSCLPGLENIIFDEQQILSLKLVDEGRLTWCVIF